VLAVVVTYNPDPDLAANLDALRAQIDDIVIVDNASRDGAAIAALAASLGIRLIANPANLGIAAALNAGARLALEEGYDWLATFDQDSRLEPNALDTLAASLEAFGDHSRVGLLAMSHVDRGTGRSYHRFGDTLASGPDWRTVRTTITSGMLIRAATLRSAGLFDETLFIDAVDHDFALGCRARGWLILESRSAILRHALGAAAVVRAGPLDVPVSNHSALRRYYITRNQLRVCLRRLGADPYWSLRELAMLALSTIAVLVLESDRRAKARAVALGLGDWLRGRSGPFTGAL
jgi:rhamnosyltransferase